MHVGVAHHLGWAVLVTATGTHDVVDRRRVQLVDDGLPAAPIHHHSGVHPLHDADPLDDDALVELASRVRASARSNATEALDALDADLPASIESISLRDWPGDFPTGIAVVRRARFESQVDSVMYRQELAGAAQERGWRVHRFDAKTIEADAIALLGLDALGAPRATLGPPWNKDHRMAFAAAIVAARRHD